MQNNKIVTRFAPSPTGFVHIGGIRTALYAYLLARKHNGTFILRIEDTDRARVVPGSLEHIQESLKWLGLDWDFGPDKPGPFGSTIQSERRDTYIPWAKKLIEKGLAYPDPYTQEEVEGFRKKAEEKKRPFLYRNYRPEVFGEWDRKTALRYKVPEIKRYEWEDRVFGKLSAGEEALDDIVIIKADGFPVYALAHIIDDYNMGVTHILRSDEWISSVPRFLSLYESLEIPPPIQATLPPILRDDRTKKLGKRDGAKDVLDYKKEGYLPIAILNYIALIGWNPGTDQEIFTLDELIEVFSIDRIQKAGGAFNEEKLKWVNREHMKKLSQVEVEKNILEWLPVDKRNPKLVPIIFDRISKWSDVTTMVEAGELDFFFTLGEYSKENLIYKDIPKERIFSNIDLAIKSLEQIEEKDFNIENIKNSLMSIADSLESRGALLHPVRYALSGLSKSPDPFIIASILGKNETLKRLKNAIN